MLRILPWIYAIARYVRVDACRKKHRIATHESAVQSVAELTPPTTHAASDPFDFEGIIASLPAAQKEVITMLKVAGLSSEQVAEATSSSVGAVKQKAHRAYQRMRILLRSGRGPVDELRYELQGRRRSSLRKVALYAAFPESARTHRQLSRLPKVSGNPE